MNRYPYSVIPYFNAYARGEGLPMGMSTQNRVLVREPAQGRQQGIELARGEQFLEPAQAMEHPLPDLAADPFVLDHEEIGAVAVGLGADEHAFLCVITIVRQSHADYKQIIQTDF
jgi:hypothetical protein